MWQFITAAIRNYYTLWVEFSNTEIIGDFERDVTFREEVMTFQCARLIKRGNDFFESSFVTFLPLVLQADDFISS
jgi:hypothetical protein